MRTLSLCVVIVLASAVVSSGRSPAPEEDVQRGNWLLVSCQLTVRHMDDTSGHEDIYESDRNGVCSGLVEGVSDISPKVCPPEHTSYGQEARVVVKYLQDHPEELNLRDTVLVERALERAFPCR